MQKMQAEGVDAENVSPEEMAKRMMEGMQNPNVASPTSSNES